MATQKTSAQLEVLFAQGKTPSGTDFADFISSSPNLLDNVVTNAEFSYLNGTTSAIQTQIDGKLSTTGGAMTGAITTNSTFDGRDVAADGVTADAALPKTGGAMTGAITGNVAITAFRPIISTTSPTINLANGTHEGSFIYSDLGTAVTVNIIVNSTQAFPVGTEIDIIQAGAGVVTLTPTSGVELNGDSVNIAITAQWGGVTLKQITVDSWIAVGKI